MSKFNNISPNNKEGSINEQTMLQYLQGNLPSNEMHELEKQMADNAFLNDAVEGLEQLNSSNIMQYVDELNANLQKQTKKKKLRKQKRKLKEQDWIIISVATILMLAILGYAIIKLMHKANS